MQYLYLAMFLQEIDKEINGENILKVFSALDLEADQTKVQFLIPALSILADANKKKVKRTDEDVYCRQFDHLKKPAEACGKPAEAYGNTAEPCGKPAEACGRTAVNVDEKSKESMTNQSVDSPAEAESNDKAVHGLPARYIYGLADKGEGNDLGVKGLDGAPVYTIPYKDMSIVVHDCLAEPYKSDDEAVVKEWLFTQQEVLDAVAEKFGVVLPMSFDMIIEGKNGCSPEETVLEWLEKNYDGFLEKMIKIRGRQEYGVQVIMDTEIISAGLIESDEILRTKKKEIDMKPEGIAYMEREMLKDLLKEKIEEAADQYFREYFSRIKKYTDDVVIGKVKKVGGSKQMLMNLSCLVKKDMVRELGEELERIEGISGLSVRFSGPWAPYSFVTPEKTVMKNG
jgi:hypothetical protein